MSRPVKTAEPLRFGLRSLLIIVALVALGCTFLPSALAYHPESLRFRVAAALFTLPSALIAFAFGTICAHLTCAIMSIRIVRYSAWMLLVLIWALTCYLVWAHQRWLYFDDPFYPRLLPYPDELLQKYHNWLDARNPAAAGHIKIHGEFYTVMEHLHFTIFAAIIVAFFMLGLIAPNVAPQLANRVRDFLNRYGAKV
ncbi:MAG TPA: hypothetical protein VJ828_12835 [Lacipirellulaceae bacterium]|nr:hypothetical protein [Lacipirellulaceae bacterium]